jgi:anti-anti-sigma factor
VTVLAEVAVESHGDVPVATLSGEIDSSNVQDIATRLRALMTNRMKVLVVDLTPLGYLDSAGINLLFTVGDELRGRQQTLRLVVAEGSPIRRMLQITSLDRAQPTFPTRDEALGAA